MFQLYRSSRDIWWVVYAAAVASVIARRIMFLLGFEVRPAWDSKKLWNHWNWTLCVHAISTTFPAITFMIIQPFPSYPLISTHYDVAAWIYTHYRVDLKSVTTFFGTSHDRVYIPVYHKKGLFVARFSRPEATIHASLPVETLWHRTSRWRHRGLRHVVLLSYRRVIGQYVLREMRWQPNLLPLYC